MTETRHPYGATDMSMESLLEEMEIGAEMADYTIADEEALKKIWEQIDILNTTVLTARLVPFPECPARQAIARQLGVLTRSLKRRGIVAMEPELPVRHNA